MKRIENVSRRGFLKGLFGAGALVLAARFVPSEALAALEGAEFQPSIWLGLETDGTLRIVASRSEMGTGIRTSLPLVVADEMEADWSRVRIEQAIGDRQYGDQNTDGSRSIVLLNEVMHEAGATARLMLEQAAAAKWGVPASECRAQLHEIVHAASGRRLGFGELATTAAELAVPEQSALRFKDKADYRYIGKEVPIYDLRDLCTGGGTFGMDAKLDGMVYASIEHPPVLGAKITSVDDSGAKNVRGVQGTTRLPDFTPPHAFQALGGVAVIADSTWAAFQGRKQLKIEWDLGPNASYTSAAFKETLRETARQPGRVVRNVGDVDQGFAQAAKTIEAEYYVPHQAHAPMEPPVAVADFRDGKVEIWSPTQNPQAVQQAVSAALGIEQPNVVAHVTLLGGGFGRKSKPDYCVEAALLSRELGKPVKVVWSREDDIHFDYLHGVAAMYMKAGLDAAGKPTGWLQRTVVTPIFSTFNAEERYASIEVSQGWSNAPFDLANHRAENGPAEAHVRIGWMRSVGNIPHAFAISSFVDELAHDAGRDPKDYLLELIGEPREIDVVAQGIAREPNPNYPYDTGRLRRVIELAAANSGWANRNSGNGRGFGIAAHYSFLTYVAAVVEVEIDAANRLKIPNIWIAADAGKIVHAERVRGQFEGAAVFGASLAMMGEITTADGRVNQSNFHDYPVARIHQAPVQTHVAIVESDAAPAGVGEPGVPPVAPALCNAIFAANGRRVRELPLNKQQFQV